jgi:glucose-6-phosphate dehydrogenase assembly protein OpcA
VAPALTSHAEPAVSWEGAAGSVSEVAGQLRKMRAQAAEGRPHGRSTLLNLVVWAPTADDVAAAFDLLDVLVGPSRIVVLSPNASATDIGARLHVHTHASPIAATTVCEEMVWLTLPTRIADHAASVVTPLVRGDLPTFVWWPAPPDARSLAFRELVRAADRVVTESDRGREGARAAGLVANQIAAGDAAITDLAWGALTPWRQLIARVLRPAQVAALRTGGATAILTHTGAEPTLGALLLAGWLLDELGPDLTVSFEAVPGPLPMLAGVEISEPGGHRLEAHRPSDAPSCAIEVQTPGEATRTRTLPLRMQSRMELLAGELEISGRDLSFERAATIAGRFPVAPSP